jgi:hypothetical protein
LFVKYAKTGSKATAKKRLKRFASDRVNSAELVELMNDKKFNILSRQILRINLQSSATSSTIFRKN